MTCVRLVRRTDGRFVSCSASGHAGYAEHGSDIVCSALTALLRTTAQVLSEIDEITVDEQADVRGQLHFTADAFNADNEADACLRYAGRFLEKGLSSLKHEFPAYIELNIQRV